MSVFDLINDEDLYSLGCLMGLLYLVGTNMADPRARRWGWRAAAVAYVVFVGHACATTGPTGAADLVSIAFRGLFAGGLTVGVAWMTFSMALFLYDRLPSVERGSARPVTPQPEPPEIDREAERREQEQRKRQHEEDVAKCDELRLGCELLYSRNAEQLQGVLPADRFGTLLDSYLSGQSDPEVVRNRTDMIARLVTEHVSEVETSDSGAFETLRELAAHFTTLRREAQELPYDEDARDTILTAVNKQEDEAIEAFFRRTVP